LLNYRKVLFWELPMFNVTYNREIRFTAMILVAALAVLVPLAIHGQTTAGQLQGTIRTAGPRQ